MSGLIQQPPEEAASCSLILCWLRQAGGKMATAIPGRLPRLGHPKGEKNKPCGSRKLPEAPQETVHPNSCPFLNQPLVEGRFSSGQ